MDEILRGVHEQMLRLGLGSLSSATWHAHLHSPGNDCWPEISVLQAAHAAELIIKARIAQEHPLLIFDHLPGPLQDSESPLNLEMLFYRGRTIQYQDLPDRLWAVTGITLPSRYREFGHLRNMIQHFASPPDRDLSTEALEFIYEVLDPLMNRCWGLFAVDFNDDDPQYEYLMPALVRRGIPFLVSPDAQRHVQYCDFDWPDDNPEYLALMESRLLC